MNVPVAIALAVGLGLALAVGLPVYVSLGLTAVGVVLAFDLAPVELVSQLLFASTHSWNLLAIPLFITAGEVLTRAGISRRLIELAEVVVGDRRGGLGLVTVAVSVFFAGISGSGPADVAALGTILIPALTEAGYPKERAAALVAAGGGIGIIVPPSIALILYGTTAGTSISALFIGGIVPGLVVAACLGVAVWWGAPPAIADRPRATFGEALRRASWGLAAPLIILGGIYGGVFTPTEAAAVAAVYAVVVGVGVHREVALADLPAILVSAAKLSAVVMVVVASASLFAWVLTTQGVARAAGVWVGEASGGNPWLFLLLANVILLGCGLFLDAVSIYLVVTPLLLPAAQAAGVDPVHFGLVMTVNLAVGQVTPPVGVNLMVASALADVPLGKLARAALPLVAAELVALALISAVPALTTALPAAMVAR